MKIDEITKNLDEVIISYQNDFQWDYKYDCFMGKDYYVEYCTKSIEQIVNSYTISDRFNLFKYLFPMEKIEKNYIRKIAEKYVEVYLKLTPPVLEKVSTILCISNKTFFEDLQKILDNKDKGIEESVTLANIEDKMFNSKNGLYVGPTG